VKQVLRYDVDEHVARLVNSACSSVGDLDRNDRESAGASSPMLVVIKQTDGPWDHGSVTDPF
jgi:hypothetical protein